MININKFEDIEIKKSSQNVDYFEALKFMENRVENILLNKEKELIWFLNHDHIYTQGTSSKNNEIISKVKVPIIKTNRGGKTTYHGPGQRIIYLMIDLNKRKKDIRKFVNIIEESLVMILKDLNIEAKTFPNRVGIWVTKSKNKKLFKEKKIGAIGLRIKKWVTYHGLSFNLNPQLKYYKNIHACGLKNYSNTSIDDLKYKLNLNDFDKLFLKNFKKKLKKF